MSRLRILSIATALLMLVGVFAAMPADANEKPRIAVLEFVNKAENTWWYNSGGAAAQDVFVTELVKSGKFRVIDRERLSALMREKNLSLNGDIDPATAVRAGKLLGVEYFLTGAVTEYGRTESSARGGRIGSVGGFSAGRTSFVAALNARIIDSETGEILWADEARGEDKKFRVSVGGFGGGVDRDQRMFDKVMRPVIDELVASIKNADL
ncbi:MAG: CsgG/HfaB family protein [Acidobacteriota bacterium]